MTSMELRQGASSGHGRYTWLNSYPQGVDWHQSFTPAPV